MADKKFMVDLPDPSRPGEFHSEGPLTEAQALAYLRQWYPSTRQEQLFDDFVTELSQGDDATDGADEEAPATGLVLPSPPVSELEAPRYLHDCAACVYEGRFGRYDAYFCAICDGGSAILRYGDKGGQYKSRPRFIHERDPEGFPEAAAYTAVFAKHPRKEAP